MKKIIIALAVLFLAAACTTTQYGQGQTVYQETPGFNDGKVFVSTNACQKACMQLGFEQGTCKPMDSLVQSEKEIGHCVIEYTTSCMSPGQCKCYCYRTPGNVPTKGYWP